MVLVPPGCFEMGSSDSYPSESPKHTQCIDTPFWIDRFEVTNQQIASFQFEFELALAYPEPLMPRVNVFWAEAHNYCVQRDARLPTELEWEYAARGAAGSIYPWGNDFKPDMANICDANCPYDWKAMNLDDGFSEPAPVGSFPAGASWVGAEDMAGNVWEWTSTAYNEADFPYPYDHDDGREEHPFQNLIYSIRVLRGGSWGSMPDGVRASVRRGGLYARTSGIDIGFRCVRNASELQSSEGS